MRVLLMCLMAFCVVCETHLSLMEREADAKDAAALREAKVVAGFTVTRLLPGKDDAHLESSRSSVVESLDSMSLGLLSLLRLKAFAKASPRSTRVTAAIGLAFMLVFFVFFLAVQLQRAVINEANIEAESQEPVLYRDSSIFTDAAKA